MITRWQFNQMPRGAVSKYSEELAEIVITMLYEAAPLVQIAAKVGVSLQTIDSWRISNSTFNREFIRAQDSGFEVQADSLLTIPDTYDDVNRARVKCDSIKWVLARRASAKYGDRLDVNVTQHVDIGAALAEARRRSLPMSYHDDTIDGEIVETKQLTNTETTDNKSVQGETPLDLEGEQSAWADMLD